MCLWLPPPTPPPLPLVCRASAPPPPPLLLLSCTTTRLAVGVSGAIPSTDRCACPNATARHRLAKPNACAVSCADAKAGLALTNICTLAEPCLEAASDLDLLLLDLEEGKAGFCARLSCSRKVSFELRKGTCLSLRPSAVMTLPRAERDLLKGGGGEISRVREFEFRIQQEYN